MKKSNPLIKANIENLSALWRTVGTTFDSYYRTADFEFVEISDSEWPNRLWLQQPITQDTVDLIKEKLVATPSNIILPIWEIYDENEDAFFAINGFKVVFEQVGMSLKLSEPFDINGGVKVQVVTNEEEANIWSTLFIKSFGYVISAETLIKTFQEIDYYIAYHNGIAVGTALLYRTNNIMGIHAVGIPPEMRRRGYADQIMRSVINIAIENESEYICLQASDMGKSLYLNLGFKEEFLIKNYALQS